MRQGVWVGRSPACMYARTHRLMQGLESDIPSALPRLTITEARVAQVNEQLHHLKERTRSLAFELSSNLPPSRYALTSMFTTMAQMEQKIGALHEAVDGYGFVWSHGRTHPLPLPPSGSAVPMGILLPVTIDCVMDGFLLGATSSVSAHAGHRPLMMMMISDVNGGGGSR